ncbi:hypothetical protein [Streptomyces sp. NPDC054784]
MPSLPPDAERLRVVETFLRLSLGDAPGAAVEAWLVERLAEVRAAACRERGGGGAARDEAAAEGVSRAATAPQGLRWYVTWGRAPVGQPRPGVLHRESCWVGTGELMGTAAMLELARSGAPVSGCDVCSP